MCENSRCSATASSPSHAPPAPDHAQPEGDLSLYQPLGHLADWPATRPLSPQADDHRVAVLVGLVTGHAAGAIFARAASHEPRRSMDVGGCWLERVSDLLGPTTCFAAKQSGVKGGTRSNEERGLCFLAGCYFFFINLQPHDLGRRIREKLLGLPLDAEGCCRGCIVYSAV